MNISCTKEFVTQSNFTCRVSLLKDQKLLQFGQVVPRKEGLLIVNCVKAHKEIE